MIYPATVIDNQDTSNPDSGRVKVRVYPLMKDVSDAVLPWAAPAFGLFTGGASGKGTYTVPDISSKVYVFFAAGDIMSPIYFAEAPFASDGPSGAEPGKRIWKTGAGHTITVSDKSGEEEVSVVHSTGATIKLDKDGNIEITNSGSSNVKLGKGTLRKLLTEAAAAVFDNHTHLLKMAGIPATANAGAQAITADPPATSMGSSTQTSDTKAS